MRREGAPQTPSLLEVPRMPPVVGGHSEYIKASLVGEALTPDVHEFSALFEFDSTFVANTVIAHVGRLKNEGGAEPRLGTVGLRRERRWHLKLDDDGDLIVRLKPVYDVGGGSETGTEAESGAEPEDADVDEDVPAFEERPSGFRHFFRGGVHLFYKHLGGGQYKAAISVYRSEKDRKTRILVSSKGEFFEYDREKPEELFHELFSLLKEALSFFETRGGVKIEVSRARLYPVRLELKVKYDERREPRAVAVIRELGRRFPNRRDKSIRIEESVSNPGTFPLASATVVHPEYEDDEWYVKTYRRFGYRSPAKSLEDHPCFEIRCLWRERRDLLRDEAFRELVAEDVRKARCFLNEIVMMTLDVEKDVLPLHEGFSKPLGPAFRDAESRKLVRVLNFLLRNPPVRKEEVRDALKLGGETERVLRALETAGLARRFEVKAAKGRGLELWAAATPSYNSEAATALCMASDEVRAEEMVELNSAIARTPLHTKIVEFIARAGAATAPKLAEVLGESRYKVYHALRELVRKGVLRRFKAGFRDVFYAFASESVRVKVLRILQALGFRPGFSVDIVKGSIIDELRKMSAEVREAVLRVLSKLGPLFPLKLEAFLRGLEEVRDRRKDAVKRRALEILEVKGYVTTAELFEEFEDMEIVEKGLKELRDGLKALGRRAVYTETERGFALIALEWDQRLKAWAVPHKLRWRLRPRILGVSA